MKSIQVQAVTATLAAIFASSAAASINEPVALSSATTTIERELAEFEPQLELDFLPFGEGEVSLLDSFPLVSLLMKKLRVSKNCDFTTLYVGNYQQSALITHKTKSSNNHVNRLRSLFIITVNLPTPVTIYYVIAHTISFRWSHWSRLHAPAIFAPSWLSSVYHVGSAGDFC